MPDPDTRFDGRAPTEPGAPGDAGLLAVFSALPAPAVLFAADAPRFTLVAVSDALMAATQRPRESFIGLPLAEAFPVSRPGPAEAGDVDGLRASLEAAVRTGTPQRMARQRYDLQRPDGAWEQRGWDALNTPVAGPGGAVRWILHQIEDAALPTSVDHAAGRDEHAGETPRERDARYRFIIESARDYAILTADTEGIIESWSPGAEAVFGWSAAEAVGQPLSITFTLEDREAGVPEQERAQARANGSAPDVRWHLRGDGTRVFIDGITRAVPGPGEAARGFLKIGQDVTRRRLAEDALRESEERFRAVANLVPDLLSQSAPGGEAHWFNDRWYEYTGQTPGQSAGWGWTDAIHPDDRARSSADYARAVAEGRPLRQEHRIRAAGGGYRWFQLRAEPQHDPDGRILRWFGAATDVHVQRMALEEVERRVAERTAELGRAWEARGEALRQLVTAEENERRRLSRELHDSVGQLVTGMMLSLKTLERSPDPAAAIADLERLGGRIAREVHALAMELRPPALDNLGLGPALKSHLEEWSDRTGIACDFHTAGLEGERLAPEVESTVYRVMQEGITNVLKHAAATHVDLVLERRRGTLTAILEDDGRGFDADEILAARRLGLRGMRERIALLGGELEIESAPGSGTTLFVRIPDPAHSGGGGRKMGGTEMVRSPS